MASVIQKSSPVTSPPNSPSASWSDTSSKPLSPECQSSAAAEAPDFIWNSTESSSAEAANYSLPADSVWWSYSDQPPPQPPADPTTNKSSPVVSTPLTSPPQQPTPSLISSGWPLDVVEQQQPLASAGTSIVSIPRTPEGFTKQLSGSLSFPFVSFKTIEELKSRALLNDIPLRLVSNMPAVDQDKIEKTNLPETQMTYLLLKAGYDIRLGERGRSSLKQEISKRTKILTDIKDTCFSTITRLKQANIYQLVQFSEICGILDRALEISQTYWRKYSRRQRSTRLDLNDGDEFFAPEVKREADDKTDGSSRERSTRSNLLDRRVRRKKKYSEDSSSDHSSRRKRADRRKTTSRGDLLTSLPISAEFTHQDSFVKSEMSAAALPDDPTNFLLEQMLLQAVLNPCLIPAENPSPDTQAADIQVLVESLANVIGSKADSRLASSSEALDKFEATIDRLAESTKDPEKLREPLDRAHEILRKTLEAASAALVETDAWSKQKLDTLLLCRAGNNTPQ